MPGACCESRSFETALRCDYRNSITPWTRPSRSRKWPCIPAIAWDCSPTAAISSRICNAGRGAPHLRSIVESLALVHPEPYEADHARAAHALLSEQHRRSLIVWITDLAETAGTPDVVEYALQMTRRHLVLFAAVGQPDLHKRVAQRPESEEEMFRYVAAIEIVQRRELLLRRLRQQGVLAMELMPGALAAALVNHYLDIKDRSLI